MSLTLALIILASVFIVPAVFLSFNRLRMYLTCSTAAFFVIASIVFANRIFPSLGLEAFLGRTFYFFSEFLITPFEEFSMTERYHLSFQFFLLLLYFVIYLLAYIPMKIFFIGQNPSVHRQRRRLYQIFAGILFIITTYGALSFFIINIRGMLPLRDGFLGWLFTAIYPLEA